MLKSMGVSAAAGLLLGIVVIVWLDGTVAPGGVGLDRYGKAGIILICTAICTVLGGVFGYFKGSSPD
ncbi:hypothetical protein ACROSR_07185 [Roseovarius tibetensis]|uniref:hypothetical protein n=1 Tax=Roseovarius tibetensis TaxID=2685897 RepID=UPI003D7FA738